MKTMETAGAREKELRSLYQIVSEAAIRCNGVNYLLVHGGPMGFKQRYEDPVLDSVWKRLDEYSIMPPGKTVIFGHTPTDHYQAAKPMRIFHGMNMIGIDCGCAYRDGRLACLRLDDMQEFYSEPDWESDLDELERFKSLMNESHENK